MGGKSARKQSPNLQNLDFRSNGSRIECPLQTGQPWQSDTNRQQQLQRRFSGKRNRTSTFPIRFDQRALKWGKHRALTQLSHQKPVNEHQCLHPFPHVIDTDALSGESCMRELSQKKAVFPPSTPVHLLFPIQIPWEPCYLNPYFTVVGSSCSSAHQAGRASSAAFALQHKNFYCEV